jgi:hypothetical protein
MSEDYTNGQLGDMIKDGFTEVHKRQDKTNGRINKIELWKAKIGGVCLVLSCIVVPLTVGVLGPRVQAYFDEPDTTELQAVIDTRINKYLTTDE